MKDKLTPQQTKFAIEVASGKTQSDAYRFAYPKSKKWNDKGVWEKASTLMTNVKVQQRIAEIQANASRKAEVTLIHVLEKLAELLNFNLKTIFNEDGTMKQIHEMTDQEAACIQDYQVEEIWNRTEQIGVIKKVKLVDKLGVIDKQLRRFGAYIENRNIKFDQEDLSHIADILNSIK